MSFMKLYAKPTATSSVTLNKVGSHQQPIKTMTDTRNLPIPTGDGVALDHRAGQRASPPVELARVSVADVPDGILLRLYWAKL